MVPLAMEPPRLDGVPGSTSGSPGPVRSEGSSPAGARAERGSREDLKKKTLIVIPAHNEQENIRHVIEELRGLDYGLDAVVVDDASTDGTPDVLRRLGQRTVRLSTNLGYGGAVQSGFKYALAHGYDYVIQMDGDCQHDPASIPALIDVVHSGQADVALGSRFLGKVTYHVPLLRKAGIALFRSVVSFFMKQKITDPTSGFQAQ